MRPQQLGVASSAGGFRLDGRPVLAGFVLERYLRPGEPSRQYCKWESGDLRPTARLGSDSFEGAVCAYETFPTTKMRPLPAAEAAAPGPGLVACLTAIGGGYHGTDLVA